uniref:non-specific serine/threonine protein kinase n=1 Tax=Mastacembelus armatus TaxID=205130 RepID=A0A3Q3LRG0_9TELE
MTSRRPMTRSFSGNGRTSSFSEDEGSSSNGRSESRNSYLSNVRPENRSTLCSVMAQLTEETQPSFETTLKSKAVSENCNVKFTCVVSGYPAPELKWYKDDMEMDRYCGLPKYEIHRNGKMHTLHIYNCTLDDAAIYQVSASNSKGIVSCSGVLEVGVMNEFKIHQQFFAKLKKKADKKKKELEEQTKKEDKENIQIEKPQTTPERPPRKRPVPPPQERPAVKDPETVEQLGMEEKGSRIVTAIKEVPVNPPEPDGLVVFSQTNHQTARDESSPKEDISVLPQTKAPNEEECTPSSTLTSSKDSWSPTQNVISVSDSDSLAEAPTETLQEEEMSVNKMGKEFKPDTEDSRSSNKLWVEEKAEVKLGKQCSDINRSEITELTTSSLEEKIEPCESQTPGQVSSRLSAVMVAGDNIKEEAECTLLIQEMNVGFPPIATHESLEMGDLKTQHEGPPVVTESSEVHNLSAIQSSESDFSKERSELKGVLNSALKNDLEIMLCNSQETEENAILENKNTGERNVSLQSEIKTEKKVEKLDELEIPLVTQNEESNAKVLEELSKVVCQDGNERQLGWPLGNIPQIQISTTEDTLDITQPVPDVNQNEHFIIPKIEIMEPEFKECRLPLTILALNKPKSDPAVLQEHDAIHVSEVIIQAESKENSPGSLPTQNNCNLSPTQKVKEVAQLDDKPEIYEREQSHVKSGEQLSQMEYALIPVKNVSLTNDKKDDASADAQVSHTLQPCHQFDVSIVPVDCHENDPRLTLPAPSEWTETETSDVTRRGTKYNVDNNRTTKPESHSLKQNLEVVAENSIKDSIPLPYEALISKIGHNVPSISKTEDNALEILKIKPLKEITIVNSVFVEDQPRNRASVEKLSSKPPIQPPLSPASARKFMSRTVADSDNEAVKAVPIITVSDRQTDKADEDLSGGSTPTSSLSRESSPRLKRRDSLSLIRSATPEELASGARRKIFIPKAKEDGDGVVVGAVDTQGKKETSYMSPSQARRAALLQTPTGQNTPPLERRSPLLGRRKATLEVPKVVEETPKEEPISTKKEEKPAEKKRDPLKAPQVIRKIRGEPFPDASGHLKLWCQFFNVLSDSTIKWYKDEEEILEIKRSGGDESQVALAIVLASSQDCGVYGCTINNEYGTDTTDFLLSIDIMSEILLRDYLEVGEEIEMTPLLFAKGLADSGNWGDKYFGRIMTEIVYIGEGYAHKASRVKAIYGLDPVFESGSTCIIKIKNPIAYGTKQESNLAEMNLAITKHECKLQNLIREYCKIFAAEARANENFGNTLEVIPRYLMYRPANSVPYATVEADLKGVFSKYCTMDAKGKLFTQTVDDVEQKCSTFQHWIHQWTHGNLLVTRLEGVETKLTNVGVVTKSKGYQGLTQRGSPEIFEQFMTHHQCNYYCGLLGLHPLKPMESQQPKTKGSKSPLLNRKLGSSPQMSRKASPKVTRKVQETEDNKSDATSKPAEIVDALEMR